jgi:hypothetical protein
MLQSDDRRIRFKARKEVPLSVGDLHTRLDYNPETGLFTHRLGAVKGLTAGCPHKVTGYVYLKIADIQYAVQHLVWMYAFGEWPAGSCILHLDGNKTNNRIDNLYDYTRDLYAASRARIGVLRPEPQESCRSITRNPKGGFRPWTALYRGVALGTYETRAAAIEAYEEVAEHFATITKRRAA